MTQNDQTATPRWRVETGDCIELMRRLIPDGYVDAIVTDPPYGLGFMGKKWDALPPGEEWAQLRRVRHRSRVDRDRPRADRVLAGAR